MKFESVNQAFNCYKSCSLEQIETRAKQIRKSLDEDPDIDTNSLEIELMGLDQARKNAVEKMTEQRSGYNFLEGAQLSGSKKQTETENVIDSPEYRSAFFKHMLGREMTSEERSAWTKGLEFAEKRTDAYTTSTDAVAVLPTQTLNEVIKKARTMGGLLAEARHFAVPSKIAIPIGTPSDMADWHTEGSAVDTEKVEPTSVVFDGYEIMKIFSISAKVRTMSIPAFESYLIDELTDCVMARLDYSLVNGTGTNQGRGLEAITYVEGTNLLTVDAGSWLSFDKLTKFAGMLKRGYAQGAKFAMNNATLFSAIWGMVDSNGHPIFVSDPKGETVGRIFGHEVVIDDNIADDDIYFGNFAKYMGYNLPEGLAIEKSTQSSFKKGLIDYRALAVADTQIIIDEAFVKLTKDSD